MGAWRLWVRWYQWRAEIKGQERAYARYGTDAWTLRSTRGGRWAEPTVRPGWTSAPVTTGRQARGTAWWWDDPREGRSWQGGNGSQLWVDPVRQVRVERPERPWRPWPGERDGDERR